jgi:predicted DsbA family dithiol-disulfide isomerase
VFKRKPLFELEKMSFSLTVDVVSDVLCPWCFIGARRLNEVLALKSSSFKSVQINWHPYRLLPPSFPPALKLPFYQNKFGSGRFQQALEHVSQEGRSCGINFNYSDKAMIGPTTDAHRLIAWVPKEKQTQVVEELFSAHHEKGLLISDHNTLAECAATCGIDRDAVLKFLQSDKGKDEVDRDIQNARQDYGVMGGVPHFVFTIHGIQEAKAMISGGQSSEYFRLILERAIQKAGSSPAI